MMPSAAPMIAGKLLLIVFDSTIFKFPIIMFGKHFKDLLRSNFHNIHKLDYIYYVENGPDVLCQPVGKT